MIYLLDSNVWITFLRKPASPVVPRLKSKRPDDIRACSPILAELYHGCLRSTKPAANRAKIDALLMPYVNLNFDKNAADQFAILRHFLDSQGNSIGPYDLQIAAIAIINN